MKKMKVSNKGKRKKPNKRQSKRIRKWCVFRSLSGKPIQSCWEFDSTAQNSKEAFKSLPPEMQERYKEGHVIKPYPKRLEVKEEMTLNFEIAGLENENGFPAVVSEKFANIGFYYVPNLETAEYLRKMAPVAAIKKLANLIWGIYGELNLKPESTIVEIRDHNGFGAESGYGGRAIISQDRRVLLQLELSSDSPLNDIDFWNRMIWHEARHIQYTLEGRWPSIWPFFPKNAAPLWVLDDIAHFSIDGWLERNNKPTMRYTKAVEETEITDLKSFRLSQFRNDLKYYGCKVSENAIKAIADDLWERDTNIREVYQIVQCLGLEIPENTPLGAYLKNY